ncbi:MAG TPA: ATP-binding protein [Caulobacteraceae bacterium]|jgi:PAS domain S-box-containing protein
MTEKASEDSCAEVAVASDLLALAGVGVFSLPPGGPIEWSQPLKSAAPFDARALTDRFEGNCHPDDYDRVMSLVGRLWESGGEGDFEYRIRRGDGGWLKLRTTYRTTSGAEGHTLRALVQDVTAVSEAYDTAVWAEKQVRALMEESRVNARRLKLALGAAQAGVFEIDHEAETFWCSPEFVLLIGRQMSYAEACALPWSFVHPDDRAEVREAARVWMKGALLNAPLDLRIVRPDGQSRWVRLYYELKRDVRGRARRSVGLMLDIDERKRQELALIQAEKAAQAGAEAKSRFLASVSHEIRTPMNGVLGVLHLLKSEALSEGARGLLDEALACGKMLSELINDVLDFSKIEADQLELAPEPTDPAATLDGVARLLLPQCAEKGLYLRLEVEPGIGWALVDPIRLRQALFNLLGNAVKFTLEGGVEVRLRAAGAGEARRLRFEVSDTGVGIAEEALPHIFQLFSQADSSTTRRFGGTGLGLAITRRLAHLMSGEVEVQSAEGAGTTFVLEIAAPEAAAPDAEAEEVQSLDGLRVLVVEDNPTNRTIATKVLENLGAAVQTAEDGLAGVEAAAAGGFDLILMDVQMPVMDGLEATRRIRALPGPAARTPIVALTANVMAHQRQTYLAAGMDGVAAKPISPAALLGEIARIAAAGVEVAAA